MQKISAVLVVINVENDLKKIVDNLSWADEIIMVENDSVDNTIKLAKELGVRIYTQPWLGYARQKNFAINLAKNQWVLSIDQDEVISPELAQSIKEQDYSRNNGFYLSRRNMFAGRQVRYCGWYPDWQLRLFDKTLMKFEEKEVHEKVLPVGKIGYLKGDLIHYSYKSNKEYFNKLFKYTSLDAKILSQNNKKWTLSYQIGKPIKEFFQKYISEKGFLDGFLGLKISIFSAYYRWVVISKLRNLETEQHKNIKT